MPKTGSSAIQRFFARNRAVLPALGVHYPRSSDAVAGGSDGHDDLVLSWRHLHTTGAAHPGLGAPHDVLDRYSARAIKRRVTVLSAEELSTEDAGIATLFAPLRDRFDLRVIVYLRRQDEWALSSYREEAMRAETAALHGLPDWLDDTRTRRRMDYAAMLDAWAAVVGTDAIRVLRYPHETPILNSFVRAAGLPAAVLALPFHAKRVKESVSDEVLLARLCELGGVAQRPTLDQAARDALMARYRGSNGTVCRRFRPELDQLFGWS